MSLIFSDPTNKSGIVELIDDNCKTTSISYTLSRKVRDVNLALDKAFSIIFKAGGTWQFDDSNHGDYPIITTDLENGQRDYSFTEDEQGNLILDIYKVMVKDPISGFYYEIYPVDQQTDEYTQGFWSNQNVTGRPSRYDKTANGIFLDCIPNYDSTDGLEIFISREGSYFSTSDTTKKPGFAGLFHEYLAFRPSYFWGLRNSMKTQTLDRIKGEMLEMESAMKKHYRDRTKDEVPVLTPPCVISI